MRHAWTVEELSRDEGKWVCSRCGAALWSQSEPGRDRDWMYVVRPSGGFPVHVMYDCDEETARRVLEA